jgi:hypothetical protein
MRSELFYVSLCLSISSFFLFAAQVIANIIVALRSKDRQAGLADVVPHTITASQTMEEVGKLAEAFAKAGPISTSASLSLTFIFIALILSGAVKMGIG